MRLSRKSEYACLALIHLARHYRKDLVKIETVAREEKIPRKYLESILLRLRKAGYLRSKRGGAGGYELARDPGVITLAEIVRLMDGPVAPVKSVSRYFYGHSPVESNKALMRLFKEIRDMVSRKVESTTFAMLVEG